VSRDFNGYGEVDGQSFSVADVGIHFWSLSRNDAGRITEKIETYGGVPSNYGYTYDPMGRLLTVTKDGIVVEEYRYDSVGTRTYEMNVLRGITERSMTYDEEDRLLTAGDATYQYNADGYLTKRAIGAEETTYSYSTRGELLSVTLSDGTSIAYVHDPLGRRIAKKVNGAITEKYLWQGLTRLLAVYDGSDNLVMRFLYGDSRMPVAMEKGVAVYYLAYDQVGSLRAVADGSGNVVKRIEYDSFGNILSDTNPTFEVPFGFAGGLHDRDTGLIRLGFRDYDPDTGRWTAKDPILFGSGNLDLYGYCLNDPINLIDPWGLVKWGTVFKGSVAAVAGGLSVYGGALLSMTGAGAVVGVPAVVGGAVSIGWGVSQIIIGFTDNELNLPKPSVASLTTLVATGGDVDRACEADLIVDTLSLGARGGTMAGRMVSNLELVGVAVDFVDVSIQATSLGTRREK
jgi:RHS repeat-associated protein